MDLITFTGPQPVTIDSNLTAIHTAATVAANGSLTTEASYGVGQVLLIINITGTPTGTLPTLQFSIQEVDPVDLTTTIGSATSSNTFSAAGYQIVTLASTNSSAFKVSWVVGGTTPSFSGVNVSVSSKLSAGGGSGSNASVGPINATAPGSATQIAGVGIATGNLVPVTVGTDGHVGIAGNSLVGYAGEVVGWTSTTHQSPAVDAVGALYTRGQIMTDEGSFTDEFQGSSLATALTGTLSFTNGSDQVVGVGTLFLAELDYYSLIAKATDADTLLIQVSSVEDDTHLTLLTPYQGTTQSGQAGEKTKWITAVGTGASLTVGSSLVTIAAGTTSGALTGFWSAPDYVPFLGTLKVAVDNRRANQNIYIGWIGTAANPGPGVQAAFLLDGTTNTTVKCVSGTTNTAADLQTTTITLPNAVRSTASNVYKVAPWQGQVAFYVNDILVAVHTQHILAPYADVRMGVYVVNTGVPAGATGIVTDSAIYESIDRVDVRCYNTNADYFQTTVNGRTTTNVPVPIQVSAAGIVTVAGAVTVTSATAANTKVQVVGPNTLADAFANPTTAVPEQAFLHGFNGTSWDRLRSGANNADAEAVGTLGFLGAKSYLMGFNGTTWDRLRSTTANGLSVDVTRVSGSVTVAQATAASLLATVTQGPAAAAANGWFARLTDGTNNVAVKAASTAAVATDPALVVAISPNNILPVADQKSGTSAVTQVASSITSVTLKAANSARLGLAIYNDSTSVLFVKLGTTASSTSFTVKLASQQYFELPFNHTGRVDGIWTTANGNAYVTEVTV